MKIKFTLLPLLVSSLAFAQVPNGYYDGTAGLTKEQLKTKLHQIISSGHRDKGYNALWSAYEKGDIDKFYENDGTILDIYSENPSGKDPYNFSTSKKCGSQSPKNEGECYNREHIVPQSSFGEASPMRNDYFHIFPTDGKVNSMRGNYPFAEVNARQTTLNGSKVGSSITNGYSGTAFEPIDEFKGDVARAILYFATRYQDRISNNKFGMFSANTYPSISSWALPLLLKWHKQDPPSEREKIRNDVGYSHQGNRNPFVDYPEFVEQIWGEATGTTPVPPTTPPTPPTTPPATPGASCGTEDFQNMPKSQENYATRTWTNNGITWTATNARTDQKLDDRAIVIRKGSLKSSTISNGIEAITLTTKLPYADAGGELQVFVNGNIVGTIPYSSTQETSTIPNINISGDVTIEIKVPNSARVAMDNLSWTCYSTASVSETKKSNRMTISPNPVKNGEIHISNVREGEEVKIFSISGQLVQTSKVGAKGLVQLKHLVKGIYIVSVQSQTGKIIVQ